MTTSADENASTSAAAPAGASSTGAGAAATVWSNKRPSSSSCATGEERGKEKVPRVDDDDDDANKDGIIGSDGSPAKKTSKSKEKCLDPIQPRPGFSIVSPNPAGKQKYIIYMALREPLLDSSSDDGDDDGSSNGHDDDSSSNKSGFAFGLKRCESIVHPKVRGHCFQRDGTRHVTMFEGTLTEDQAASLRFPASEKFEPVPIEFDGWMPWNAGCYLKLSDGTRDGLKALLGRVRGLPPSGRGGGKRPCNHLSLYRKRGFDDASGRVSVYGEFGRVRNELASHDWNGGDSGSRVEGVSIRIKLFGSDYDECKVLAGV